MNDLTHRFALDGIDHDELLHLLSLYYVSAWRTATQTRDLTTEIALPASKDFALRLRYKHGRIIKIFRGPLLRKQRDLEMLLEEIRVNCRDPAIKEFVAGY
jgi:hypothetical protein